MRTIEPNIAAVEHHLIAKFADLSINENNLMNILNPKNSIH
jgi:hypothetical protein